MSDNIRLKLPDNSVKEVPKGTTALDIAKSISPRLAQAAIAAQIRPMSNGNEPRLVDLSRPLESDAELRILTEKDPESLEVFRHSSAHLLAAAVLELFPEKPLVLEQLLQWFDLRHIKDPPAHRLFFESNQSCFIKNVR